MKESRSSIRAIPQWIILKRVLVWQYALTYTLIIISPQRYLLSFSWGNLLLSIEALRVGKGLCLNVLALNSSLIPCEGGMNFLCFERAASHPWYELNMSRIPLKFSIENKWAKSFSIQSFACAKWLLAKLDQRSRDQKTCRCRSKQEECLGCGRGSWIQWIHESF